MKITILNGNPEPSAFDAYLAQIKTASESAAIRCATRPAQPGAAPLRGLLGLLVKTPGQCSSGDASLEIDRAVINADFVLWAAPLKMGYPAELLKRALDKHIPLIHPYMEVAYGEAHHLRRYARSPRWPCCSKKKPVRMMAISGS